MPDTPWPNLAAMFFQQADRYGEAPFLWRKQDGVYVSLSWNDVAARVASFWFPKTAPAG
jgi:long-chain acyl-CoA synthetase